MCEYCQDCAELAAADWNGETASIAPIAPGRVVAVIGQRTRRYLHTALEVRARWLWTPTGGRVAHRRFRLP